MSFPSLDRLAQRMSTIDPEIAKAKSAYDTSLAKSLETPTISTGDAYLSGVLRLLPIIAGYAIAKKKGAVAGMQGGNIGATAFQEGAKKKSEMAQKKAAIAADAYKDVYDRTLTRKEKLEDSIDNKTFATELEREKEKGRNARSNRLAGGLSALSQGLQQGLPLLNPSAAGAAAPIDITTGKPNAPVDVTTGKPNMSGSPNPTANASYSQSTIDSDIASVMGVDMNTEQGKSIINTIKASPNSAAILSSFSKIRGMGQDSTKNDIAIAQGGKNLAKTDVETEKLGVDIKKGEQAIEEGKVSAGLRSSPIDVYGAKFVPDTSKVDEKKANDAQELARQYVNAFSALNSMKHVKAGKTDFQEGLPASKDELEMYNAKLSQALRKIFSTATDSGDKSGEQLNKDVEKSLPKMSGALGNIRRRIGSSIGLSNVSAKQIADLEQELSRSLRQNLNIMGYSEDTSSNDMATIEELTSDPAVVERALQMHKARQGGR